MRMFISPFQNPFLNLALEDYFLRGGADLPIAFFYVNRPCVVLGRFQNPWLECHLPYLVENDIWLVRRQSGGGCVFHDQGNVNFSFITHDPMVDRIKGAGLIQRAFKAAGIELEISPRNDLWLKGKKISGSAFKQTKDGSFHHGTFLVSSDLTRLEKSLKHTVVPKSTKSIASVRSQVTSLQEHYPHIEIADVLELIAHELKTIPTTIDGSFFSRPEVQQSFYNLVDWQWLWGETPSFELEGGLVVNKGLVGEERFSSHHVAADLQLRLFPDFSEQRRLSNQIL